MATIARFLYPHSIIQAFNGAELEETYLKNRQANHSVADEIYAGVLDTFKDFGSGLLIGVAVDFIAKRLFDTTSPTNPKYRSLKKLIIISIVEELVLRNIQSGIFFLQLQATHMAPKSIKENTIFKVLVSTSFRVILISLFYSSLNYFLDAGNWRSQANIAASMLNTFLQPTTALAYEERGSLVNAITAHIGRNVLVVGTTHIIGALVQHLNNWASRP